MEEILQTWINEPEVNEIFVWDNSGKFKSDLPIVVFNSQKNINPSVRYAIASMCKNDTIIHCDDDVLPLTGITFDLLTYFDKESFLSVEGIDFIGNSYFDQKRVSSFDLDAPKTVEMVIGYLTMINKKHLLKWDYSKFSKYQLEMELQIRLPKIKRVVVPTKNYRELGCGKDEFALHLQEEGRAIKEEMYCRFKKVYMV